MSSASIPFAAAPSSFEDLFLRPLILFAMLLEIAVFVEPAPVDAVLILGIGLSFALGKFSFANMGALPVVSLAVFALANIVSMYDPVEPRRALIYLLVTLYLVSSWFFFTGVMTTYGVPFMRLLVHAYCFAGLISAILGVGAYAGLFPAFENILLLAGRARGLFKDCNVYGPYFVPMALMAFLRLSDFEATGKEKAAAALYFPAATLAALFSFSRGCWANYAVAIAVLFAGQMVLLPDSGVRKRALIGTGLLAAGAAMVALVMSTDSVDQMIALRFSRGLFQDYDRIRFATQHLALQTASENPLGVGPGQAEVLFQYSTHSLYLRILTENGMVALFGFVVFLMATAWRAALLTRRAAERWVREINLVAFASIAGYLVNSAVIDTVHWRHIWFILALPWACTLSRSRRFAPLRPARRMRSSEMPALELIQG
jgi:hypothetical protein